MTVTQILLELGPYKPMTRDTLYKHFRQLKIKPVGKVRQCPQRYPEDSAKRVMHLLGIKPQKNGNGHSRKLAA